VNGSKKKQIKTMSPPSFPIMSKKALKGLLLLENKSNMPGIDNLATPILIGRKS